MKKKVILILVFFSVVLLIYTFLYCRGNEIITDSLVKDLHDADYYVQMNAIEKLVKIGEPAVPYLIYALNNGDPELRMRSAEALGRIGDRRAIAPLKAHLSDDDITVRIYAITSLGQLHAENALKSLLSLLADENWEIRSACAEALGLIGNAKAIQPLIILLEDEQPKVGNSAAAALKKITKKDFGSHADQWQQWYDNR